MLETVNLRRCRLDITCTLYNVYNISISCPIDHRHAWSIIVMNDWSSLCSTDRRHARLIIVMFEWYSSCTIDHCHVWLIIVIHDWSTSCPIDHRNVRVIVDMSEWSSSCTVDHRHVRLIMVMHGRSATYFYLIILSVARISSSYNKCYFVVDTVFVSSYSSWW
jgi:hypothetical protein